MIVIPAIDLKDGCCVRLRQGDMNHETLYSQDPLAIAVHWEKLGAQRLHVVDLNGAVEGKPQNMDQIIDIVKAVSIPIQVGGGIRSIQTIEAYLSRGVRKIVLGTAALSNKTFLAEACRTFSNRIFVGIDAKLGKVATEGWTTLSDSTPSQVFESLSPYSISGVIYTEISRDGMLKGPNLEAIQQVVQASPFPIIASGGFTRLADIHAVKKMGSKLTGVIVGKALYEGTLDLSLAIEAAAKNGQERGSC